MKFTTTRHGATLMGGNAPTPPDVPPAALKRNGGAFPQEIAITAIRLSVFDWLGVITKLFLALLLFLIPVIGIVFILLMLPGLF